MKRNIVVECVLKNPSSLPIQTMSSNYVSSFVTPKTHSLDHLILQMLIKCQGIHAFFIYTL